MPLSFSFVEERVDPKRCKIADSEAIPSKTKASNTVRSVGLSFEEFVQLNY